MEDVAGWIAPIATMLAAMMTAANLGARVTGWGFIVFTVGSIGWSIVAVYSGQQNLLWTNGFLTLVNGFGIWRWLGRQARYDDGGQTATARSATAQVPTLFAVGALGGAKVQGCDGQPVGTVVEAMMRCHDASFAYIVISEGGLGGIGERLHAVDPGELVFCEDGIQAKFDSEELRQRPVLQPDRWPATLADVEPARAAAPEAGFAEVAVSR